MTQTSTPQLKKQTVTINKYVIDVSVSEDHNFDSDVTEYPVEQGGAVTDNVRPKPIEVTIEGVVSDTPIGKIADLRDNQGDNGQEDFLPSVDALQVLLAIRDAREPVTIATSLKTFDNMVMSALSVPRDAQTGAALRFSATFQQVIFVTNNRTTVRVATPSNGKQSKLGNKPLGNSKIIQAQVDPGDGSWFDVSAPNPSLGAGATGRWRYGAQPLPGGKWEFHDGPFVKTDQQEANDNAGLVNLDPKTRQPVSNPGQSFQLVTGDEKP
jgi:hypothetical protein